MSYDASIILCTFNRAESLAKALSDIQKLTVPSNTRCEVIVVDNNSTDDTSCVIEDFSESAAIEVVHLFEKKQGKSHALNLALSKARGRLLLFTDDDVRIDTEWLNSMTTEMNRRGWKVAGGKIIPVWQSEKPKWHVDTGEFSLMTAIVAFDRGEKFREINEPLFGANMCIHRDVFERHGGFRTDLGPRGTAVAKGEDSELMGRFLGAGERVFYVPNAIIWHPVEEERTTRSYFRRFYFDDGRVSAKVQDLGSDVKRWAGIPRFLIRSLLANGFRWLFSIDRAKRFYYQLQCCRVLGSIAELIRPSSHKIK
jgi:glycosyltransferase involved in cell wall biosynthesis